MDLVTDWLRQLGHPGGIRVVRSTGCWVLYDIEMVTDFRDADRHLVTGRYVVRCWVEIAEVQLRNSAERLRERFSMQTFVARVMGDV